MSVGFSGKHKLFWGATGLTLSLILSACGGQPTEDVETPTGYPAPKSLTTSPAGPANNNNPEVRGTAPASSTVLLYSDSSCSTLVTTATASASGAFTIPVAVPDDSSTTYHAQATDGAEVSACSAGFVTYVEDSTPPIPPNLTGTTPAGPRNNNSPSVNGIAEPKAAVNLYSDAACSTFLALGAGNGTTGAFAIAISVADNTTTSLYGTSTDVAGNTSTCSTIPLTYVEDSVIPTTPSLTGTTPTSPSNNNNPSVAGTGPANYEIRLYSNASCTTQIATGTADAGGNFSIPITVPANTTRSIYAKSMSPSGNLSACTPAPLVYVEDSTAPARPVLSNTVPASPANNNNPVLNGTAEANSALTIYSDAICATVVTTATVSGAGTFSVPLTVGNDTANTYYAKAADAAGNISTCSLVRNYVEDSTAPAAPVLAATSPVSPRNFNNPTVTGTAEAGSAIHLYSNAGCTVALANGSANGSGAISIIVTVGNNTVTNIYGKATDAAGNASACSLTPLVYEEDSLAPALPVLVSTNPASPGSSNTPAIEGTGDANAGIALYSTAGCGTLIGSGTIDGSGDFSVGITVPNDSITNVYARSIDAALNQSACTAMPIVYEHQTYTGPMTPVFTGSTPTSPANENNPAIEGSADAGNSVTLYSNSACTTVLASGLADGSGNFSIPIAVGENTTTMIYAKASDGVTDSSCTALGYQYIEDSLAPAIPVLVATVPPVAGNNNFPAVTGTTEANASIQLFADAGCTMSLAIDSADGGGGFTITISVADNSSTDIYARASDLASNLSACTAAPLNYVEDSIAPAMPTITSVVPAGPIDFNEPVINGTGSPNENIHFYSDATCSTGIGSGVIDGSGNFSVQISVLDNTTTSIYAHSSDTAGNLSPCTSSPPVYIEDSIAPTLPVLVTISPSSPSNVNTPNVIGTAEANVTVSLFSNAACSVGLASGAATGAGAFTIAISVPSNSSTSIYASATDAAGNGSGCTPGFLTYLEDSIAPGMPTLSSTVPAGPANNNAPFVIGSGDANATINFYSDASCTTGIGGGVADGLGAISIALTVPDDSTTAIYANSSDAAGNFSACTAAPLNYVEDSSVPAVPTLSNTSPASPANNNAPTVNGTAEANSIVTLYSDSGCVTVIGSGTADGGGAFGFTVGVADNSTTNIYGRSSDLAGNASVCSLASLTYVEDSIAPVMPVISGTVPATRSSLQLMTLEGSAEASSTVRVYSDAACTALVTSGAAGGLGTFSVSVTAPWNQNITYYANSADAAGNSSSCSATSAGYEAYTIAVGAAYLKGTTTTAPSTPDNVNQTTAYSMLWSSSDYDYNYYEHSAVTNSHQLKVKVAGDYLMSFTLPATGAVAGANLITDIRVNGVAPADTRAQSYYTANLGGHRDSSINITVLLPGLAANDLIDATVKLGNAAGVVTVSGAATLHAEYVGGARTIFRATATQTTNSTNLNQATAYPLQWTNTIADSGFTHSNSTNPEAITLDAVGDYIVYVNVPLSGAVSNGNVKAIVSLNGSAVTGGEAKQGYISGAGSHAQSSIHWSGIVRAASANSILTVSTQLEGNAGTITVPAGQTASIFVERLSSTSGLFYGTGTSLVSGADFNAAVASNITWTTNPVKDTVYFSHSTVTDPDQITVLTAGDYLVLYNGMDTSGSQRVNAIRKIKVNGTAISGAEANTFYMRNTGGHNESSGTMAVLLRRLNVNDVISISSQTEANSGPVTNQNSSLVIINKP